MKPRTNKSPLALTEGMAATLRVVMLMPLIDAACITRECGAASATLPELISRGFVKTKPSKKRDGRSTTLYLVTLKGMSALDGHAPAKPRPTVTPVPRTSRGYTCPELGRTCHRPGAYDAFSLPSLFGTERRMPKGVL